MRYVRIASFYKPAIERYYAAFPDITSKSYAVQYRHFMDQHYSWGDANERELEKFDVDSVVLLSNVEPIIKRWSEEHKVFGTAQEIVFAQLKYYDPDIIHLNDIYFFSIEDIDRLRAEFPRLKLLIGWCCSPYNEYNLQTYKQCDFVICCCNQLSNELREHGIRTYVVMHGFDDLIWEADKEQKRKDIDILFTGSIMPGQGFHQKRNELIHAILKSGINLTIYGNITQKNFFIVKLKQLIYSVYLFIKKLDKFNLLRFLKIVEKPYPQYIHISKKVKKNMKPPVFGKDMFDVLKRSKICLNIHGDIATEDAANMRLFEATGMGCCLVTDWKRNMCALFDEGKEVVTYKDIDDCIDKLKWLLNHPERAADIAEAGQKRCLKDHVIAKRAGDIYNIIKMELRNKIPKDTFESNAT